MRDKVRSTQSNHHVVRYGSETIHFRRVDSTFSASKVKIRVLPSGGVIVHAPSYATEAELLRAVKKQVRWIWLQLEGFQEQAAHVLPRQYVSGESHFYLGRRYILKVTENPAVAPTVKLWRGSIEVTVRRKSTAKVQALLDDWYRERAREIFHRRLDGLLSQTLWVKARPSVRLLSMKTQWGSCSPKGLLTLNPHLIKASARCIDYVLLHELCHLAEHNHSDRFYRLMRQVMPGWEKIKRKLDEMAATLLPS